MNCFSKIFFSTLSQQKLMRKKFLVKQKYLLILKNKNKMKNLQEMSLNEMKRTEGGLDPLSWAIIGGLIGSMPYLYDNRDKLIAGFKAALN